MDPVKRPLEEPSDENIDTSKKIKIGNELPEQNVLNKILGNSNRARKPKKVVLLLCYLGKEYFGMQRNQNVNTVEEELFKALRNSNIILQEEFDHPQTMKFQRAARTDKGVSAVRNIVSLKIPLEEITDTLPEKINAQLPPEVRVIAMRRVTQSFDAKIACDARTYSYMLPTFAFAPNVEGSTEEFRITEERIQEVNDFLKHYLGTHNFFNFTSGRLPGDPSCKRYIMSCECTLPFESCGLEFAVIKVKGQSFMLHQIRKMVGLAIACMRNLADVSVLDKAWTNERIDIPKAPGLGLMLEELHYDWYDKKYGSDGIHQPLKWGDYDELVEVFKRDNICANIAKSEREDKSMMQWLETLPHHSYDVRDAGPPSKLPPKSEPIDNQETPTNMAIDNQEVPVVTVKKETTENENKETTVVTLKKEATENGNNNENKEMPFVTIKKETTKNENNNENKEMSVVTVKKETTENGNNENKETPVVTIKKETTEIGNNNEKVSLNNVNIDVITSETCVKSEQSDKTCEPEIKCEC